MNPRAAVISTDRQTDALSDSIFWLSLNGTLGPKKAREDPDCTVRSRRGKGVKVVVREFRGGPRYPRRRDGRTLKSGGRRRGGGPLQRGLTRTMSTAAGGLPMWSARPRQGRRSYPSSGNAAAALPPSQWPAGRRALSSTQCRARGVVDEVPELSPTSRPSSGAASDSFCTYVWGARSRSSSADATVPLQHWDRHRPAFQGERGPSNQLWPRPSNLGKHSNPRSALACAASPRAC